MSKINIDKDQFRIDGVTRPYLMRTSFCLLGFYQRGERNKARDWLDRIKTQGFDGPRVFGENEDWFLDNNEAIFFGNPKYTTKVTAWGNTNPNGGASSQIQLVSGYGRMVEQFAEDLKDRDMIAEFCTNATAKSWRNSGWSSHGANKFAQLFASMFDPHNSPFLYETINEADAHTHPEWADVTGLTAEGRQELKMMGPRWRRSDAREPSHHNFPGSTIGVSAGGQYDPGFDDGGYTHRNLHPPRGAKWDVGPDGQDIGRWCQTLRAKNQGRPLAFNETIHYMTPEQWDFWIPKVPKWVGLSTRDAIRCMNYYERCLKAGVSICVHDMNGMSTDPDAAISHLEKLIQRTYGIGDVDPVPDDPTPIPFDPFNVKPYRDAVERAYAEVLLRKPDTEGWKHWSNELYKGVSEARMREVMLRSDEFKVRFLDP